MKDAPSSTFRRFSIAAAALGMQSPALDPAAASDPPAEKCLPVSVYPLVPCT